MREAVIVSTARTPIGRAYRGAFNNTESATLGGHVLSAAVKRAGIESGEVEDIIMGCALTQGSSSMNIGRLAALSAGFPPKVSGMTVDRQCSSGMYAISIAANLIINEGMSIAVGAGLDQVSLIQNEQMNLSRLVDPNVIAASPHAYMPMLDTAEVVAKRYNISRQSQDGYAFKSQQRTAAAQIAGRFDQEIVPITSSMAVVNKETKEVTFETVTLTKDEGSRADTTLEGLSSLKPIKEGGSITAGNASQLSDGASAAVLMERKLAEQRGLQPLGIYRGIAVAGCEPDEMGIGPIFAIPKLLAQHGLKISDIGLWELNEAFAVQVLYCRDKLGIPDELLNVDGGAISIGHPYGMSAAPVHRLPSRAPPPCGRAESGR